MKIFLLFFLLISFAICEDEKKKPKYPSIKGEIRKKLIHCITSNEDISDNLKKNIRIIAKSKKPNPIIFNKIKMDENDMEIVRSCKREVFKSMSNVNLNKA